MTARGPLFEVADDDDDDEDKKLSAKATTKVTQSGQVIPSEEGQAGVFDDQEVVNLVSPQGAIGWKRSRTASERTYLVPLGGAKRDDLGTLQGILDESDGPKSIGHLDSIPGGGEGPLPKYNFPTSKYQPPLSNPPPHPIKAL